MDHVFSRDLLDFVSQATRYSTRNATSLAIDADEVTRGLSYVATAEVTSTYSYVGRGAGSVVVECSPRRMLREGIWRGGRQVSAVATPVRRRRQDLRPATDEPKVRGPTMVGLLSPSVGGNVARDRGRTRFCTTRPASRQNPRYRPPGRAPRGFLGRYGVRVGAKKGGRISVRPPHQKGGNNSWWAREGPPPTYQSKQTG